MPSTQTLSLVLVGCVIVSIPFALTPVATLAEGIGLLAFLGLVLKRRGQMSRLTSSLLFAGIVLLPLGWALIIASGSIGIGAVIVNAAFAMMLLAAAIHAARRLGGARRGRSPAAR